MLHFVDDVPDDGFWVGVCVLVLVVLGNAGDDGLRVRRNGGGCCGGGGGRIIL